jgi:CRISPR-associated protein Csb2
VQREPFEARGSRVEAFAEGTRFSKERLWHVELELDRPVEGPLVIGDGRFLGLGVMAPVAEPWTRRSEMKLDRARRAGPTGGSPTLLSGIFGLRVIGDAKDEPLALARALRRAVMARAQAVVGSEPLGRFFTGHEADGAKARADHASHLAFHWDPAQRRLLVIAPHCLDRRESTWEERRSIEVLAPALEELLELRPGSAGRLLLQFHSIVSEDPLLVAARSWTSVTPYAVTRHKKRSSAAEVILEDVIAECQRRGLPRPRVTVLEARGVPGQGLEGRARLDFEVAVNGPVVLGRTRYLGGGLFAPAS